MFLHSPFRSSVAHVVPYSVRGEYRPRPGDLSLCWRFSVALCSAAGDTSVIFGAVWCSPTAVIDDVLDSGVLQAVTVVIEAVATSVNPGQPRCRVFVSGNDICPRCWMLYSKTGPGDDDGTDSRFPRFRLITKLIR